MKTIILPVSTFKVENVNETVNKFFKETCDFVGNRFVVSNETGMPALVLNTVLSSNDKVTISDNASAHNLAVVFVETEYNVLNGTTIIGL